MERSHGVSGVLEWNGFMEWHFEPKNLLKAVGGRYSSVLFTDVLP